MKRNRSHRFFYVLCICLAAGLSSCKKEPAVRYQEPLKDLSGSWQIVKLTRNGEDLTSRIDLSGFRLIFNKDSTYGFQGKMPFAVSQPGRYRLDDPQYPFYITFMTKDQTVRDTLKFSYPIVDGRRQISFNVSPGCSKNTYNYVFEKVQ